MGLIALALANPAEDAIGVGDLRAAQAAYSEMAADGRANADVYYNLGNVLYRQENRAAAILAWRRAEVLAPRDPDVQANLDFARRGIADALETHRPVPAWAPWMIALTPTEAAWLGGLLGGAGLLVFGLAAAGRRAPIPVGAVLLVAGLLIQGSGWATDALPRVGVVLAPEARAASDLAGGVDLFALHAGAEVLVADRAQDRVLVQLPDGRKGWMDAAAVGVADPFAAFPVL